MSEQESQYREYLSGKAQVSESHGFKSVTHHRFLDGRFAFQGALTEYALWKGRAQITADCGLGKTAIQLAWGDNVVRKTNGRVLLLTPIAVGWQTIAESHKFGIDDCSHDKAARIVVANYERLHHFDKNDFVGVICDESSILKNSKGKTRQLVTEFMRAMPYRLLCTATAAPNDYMELGTASEALGELGFQDMVTKFFKQTDGDAFQGWGRLKYRLRDYAERDFWRWVCSWMRACRKPSDVGDFSDDGFILPELAVSEHVVQTKVKRDGFLFDTPAVTLDEQREDLRRTLTERCEMAARFIIDHKGSSVAWCHLNAEGDLLHKLIPNSVHVSGSDSEELKEEKFRAFQSGSYSAMVTKASVAGFGLNWQHANHFTSFPSHSFEQYYQSVRRLWRFGQTQRVYGRMITTEGQSGVLANLQRKTTQAEVMFARLIELMSNELTIERGRSFDKKIEVPTWL